MNGKKVQRWCGKMVAGLFLCALTVSGAQAGELMVAAGAGYKKPVTQVVEAFKQESGLTVNAVFGNMQMVASQAKQTGEISCIIGDKKFLAGMGKDVQFSSYLPIGKGILVLAYRKGISLSKPEDLAGDAVKTIFMPETTKAIYGIAASETLAAYGYDVSLKSKITQVATVPQVISYLLNGEADAGFVNITEVLANADKLGGYIVIPEDKYKEVMIVAGMVQGAGQNEVAARFAGFLKGDKARKIFEKFGVK